MLAWRYSRSRSPDAHLDKIITRPPPTPIRCYLQADKGRLLFDVATDRGPTKDVPAEAHRRFRAESRERDVRHRPERATQFALQEKEPHLATCLEFPPRVLHSTG